MPQTLEKQPFFSLCTVSKNNAAGLQKTWKSIDFQTFKDFEWLVQDGASKDNSLEILASTSAQTQSAPDSGIYDAMNRLIERAKGRYILFLNAGDALAAADTLQTIYAATNKIAPDFIYGDAHEDTAAATSKDIALPALHHSPPPKSQTLQSPEPAATSTLKPEALPQPKSGTYPSFKGLYYVKYLHYKAAKSHTQIANGMFTHHQAMLYNCECIGTLRYNTAYKIAADYDFTARFLKSSLHGHVLAIHIPQPICIFESGGLSQQNAAHGRREQFEIRKNLQLCSPAQNQAITALQALNWQLRRHAPALYWLLKR